MALAQNLFPNHLYPVKSGEFAGQQVQVIDNTPMPDDHEFRRRVLVRVINSDGTDGDEVYILPRLISDGNLTLGERKALMESGIPLPTPSMAGVIPSVPTIPAPAVAVDAVGNAHLVAAPTVEESRPITDCQDPRLDMWRPDPALLDAYVGRDLPGGISDTDALLAFWEERQNVLLVGDTQGGKSMLIRVIAILAAKVLGFEKPLPVFTLSGSNGVTDYDLFGQTTAWVNPETGVETLVHLPGVVDLAAKVDYSILELDEIAMMPERVTSSLHSICDDRRQFVNRGHAVKVPGDGFMPDVVHASEGLWIVGSYNDGYRGSGALQEAFTNRFVHLPWAYNEEVEAKLVPSENIRGIGKLLRAARAERRIQTPVGTSALQRFDKLLIQRGVDFSLWAFLGMFPAQDRVQAEAIITSNSYRPLLEAEYKQRTTPPDLAAALDEDDEDDAWDVPMASTGS